MAALVILAATRIVMRCIVSESARSLRVSERRDTVPPPTPPTATQRTQKGGSSKMVGCDENIRVNDGILRRGDFGYQAGVCQGWLRCSALPSCLLPALRVDERFRSLIFFDELMYIVLYTRSSLRNNALFEKQEGNKIF